MSSLTKFVNTEEASPNASEVDAFRQTVLVSYFTLYGFSSVLQALQAPFSLPVATYLNHVLAFLCRSPTTRYQPLPVIMPESLSLPLTGTSSRLVAPALDDLPLHEPAWHYDAVWLFEEFPRDEFALQRFSQYFVNFPAIFSQLISRLKTFASDATDSVPNYPGCGTDVFFELVYDYSYSPSAVSLKWVALKGDKDKISTYLEKRR